MLSEQNRVIAAAAATDLADELTRIPGAPAIDWTKVKTLLLLILRALGPIIITWLIPTQPAPPTPTDAQPNKAA